MRSRWLSGFLAAALCAGACTADSGTADSGTAESGTADGAPSSTTAPIAPTTLPPTTLPPAELDLLPSFEQFTVRGAELGTEIVAFDDDHHELGRSEVAGDGSAIVRGLPSGADVLVEVWRNGEAVAAASPVELPDDAPPSASHYEEQTLEAGFNYITARDGTTLSAYVSLPGLATAGPYPTLVEYSGYSPSDPNADDPGRFLITSLGYALIQVNVRGTGCSGGSFDAFEPIQALDGYDVIETVAAQPWASKVAMYGISYPGIMQLHVAAATPPSLAAIAPLSVIDSVESVLYPGGIYNNGFGETWSARVTRQAEAFGQSWTTQRVQAGDTLCDRNQDLRVHNPDLIQRIQETPFRNDLTTSRSPQVTNIDVPVFLAGAWQDEQTGGRFPALLGQFDSAPVVRAHLYNGLHIDPLGPSVLGPLIEFYNLYVGDTTEGLDVVTRLLIGAGLSSVFGEAVPFPGVPTRQGTLAQARAEYEEEPSVLVFFELGATQAGLPVSRFNATFEQWPPEEIEPLRLHLTDAGRMRTEAPTSSGIRSFETDPDEGSEVTIGDLSTIWTNDPDWQWREPNSAAIFTSDRFESEAVFVGPASADLYLSISAGGDGETADDADIEVTLSEIDANGDETYIQTGWLRLSRRTLDDDATELRPTPSHLERDVEPLNDDEVVLARIEVLPFAHVIRPGSRLRISVDTPGGSKPQWTFEVFDQSSEINVHTGGDNASSIVLPLVPTLDPPNQPVGCGRLRGQPCRS